MMKISTAALAGCVFVIPCVAVAGGAELPHQKAGLWQQTMVRDGKPLAIASSQICLDAAAESKFSVFSQKMAEKICKVGSIAHNPDGTWSTDSVCSMGNGIATKGHSVVSGDFNSKITMTMPTTMTGAPVPALNGTHVIVVMATWLGPCKAGQRGGDVIMANGTKVNMMDVNSEMSGGAKPH
jgi:hypothetical protein